MKLEFLVKRSPAKASWWVLCNGKLIETTDTRKQAEQMARSFERRYGWPGI